MITQKTTNNIVMENKELIPWCECTFMDVDMNTIHDYNGIGFDYETEDLGFPCS